MIGGGIGLLDIWFALDRSRHQSHNLSMENLQRTDAALRSTVALVALLNLGYFGVEFAVALAIGSVSLFADSIDFLEDATVNGLILVALGWNARRRSMSVRSPAPSAKHAIASARLGVLLQRAQLTLCGGVLGPNVGTQRSPNCSPCKWNMSLGSRQCPNRCATAPPVRHCRQSLISISTNCSPSSRPVASGGIEDALSARTAVPELAQVGAQGPPARRSARLAGVASPGARVLPMHYLDKPPAPRLGAVKSQTGGPVLTVEKGLLPDVA